MRRTSKKTRIKVFCLRAFKQHKRSLLWPFNTKLDRIKAKVVTIKSLGKIIRIDHNKILITIDLAQVATLLLSMKMMTWTLNGTILILKRQPAISLAEKSQMKFS